MACREGMVVGGHREPPRRWRRVLCGRAVHIGSGALAAILAPTSCAQATAASAGAGSPANSASNRRTSWTSVRQVAWVGTARLVEQVVRPVFAERPAADVDLWIAATVDGLGWGAAGAAAGMDKAAIARVRRRISRFLSAEGVLRRLPHRLDDVP